MHFKCSSCVVVYTLRVSLYTLWECRCIHFESVVVYTLRLTPQTFWGCLALSQLCEIWPWYDLRGWLGVKKTIIYLYVRCRIDHWNCFSTRVSFLQLCYPIPGKFGLPFHPDMTFTVDWALKTKYLSILEKTSSRKCSATQRVRCLSFICQPIPSGIF